MKMNTALRVSVGCAVLMVSSGALADTAFFWSSQRPTDEYCRIDVGLYPATNTQIPAGSIVTGLSFSASGSCDPSGCRPFQYDVGVITISHNGITAVVSDGSTTAFNGQSASGTWSTGLWWGRWGCPASVSWSFTVSYTPPPPPPPVTVTTVNPDHGPTTGGTAVQIQGTNFAAGATVQFGGMLATDVVVLDSTRLTAIAPAHAAGTVEVRVSVPGRDPGYLSNGFSYVSPPPSVTAVVPDRGLTTGGTSVTVSGTNFAPGATVTFGGTLATGVTFVSASSLTAFTPPQAVGPVEVRVTVNGQSGSLANGFTYVLHPAQIMSVVDTILQ